MSVRSLKVVLSILAEKSGRASEQFEENGAPESLFLLPHDEFFKEIEVNDLKKGINELVSRKNELLLHSKNRYIQILYKVLLVIFSNTTQKERQNHLAELLEHFYAALSENLLNSAKPTPILSKLEYHKLIRECLPLVKLELLEQLLKKYSSAKEKYSSDLKIATEELYECIRFPRILREECYVIIKKKLGTNDFKLQNFDLRDMAERDGSLGMYAKLKIFLEHKGKPTVLQFFAKFLLEQGEVLRDLSEKGFKKEVFIYTVFVPLLRNMGLENLTDFLPECYLVRPDEIILLDDLSHLGYSSLDVSNSFHPDHLLKSITPLAKLHAGSLVLEEKLSESLGARATIDEYYKESLEDIFYIQNNSIPNLVRKFLDYFLEKFPEMAKKVSVEVLKEKIDVQLSKWLDMAKKSAKYRNVVCHGDTWCNNIMFQNVGLKETDNCYFVDYQLSKYCPPAFEVLAFIYCTTDKETRSKYMTYVLGAYYNELKMNLKEHGVKIENIYPLNIFMESCENLKLFTIFHSLIYLHYILIPKDTLDAMKKDAKLMEKFMTGDRIELIKECWNHMPFRMRLKENIEEICEICENM